MTPQPARPSIAAWFDQYHDQLLRFLARSLGQDADAQDLAQEVFLRILRVEDPDLIQHPRAYLYRVAVNVIQEWRLRKQRFPIQDGLDLDQIPASGEPMTAMEASEQTQRVHAAVADLPATYRAVLMLRVTDGLTHDEVAERLGISPRMVKRYLIKAYARMRERLDDADDVPRKQGA
jgi:RNA polymerase sigma factor (sigma-70 family)